MAEPAMRAIAARFAGARVEVALPAAMAPLARTWRFVDAVLPLPVGSRVVETLARAWVPLRLRRRRFDLCVLFPNGRDAARLARLAGIPRRVGYARDGRAAWLTDPVAIPPAPRDHHMIEYYWGLATALGGGEMPGRERLAAGALTDVPALLGADPRTAPRIDPSDETLQAADRVLRRAGLAGAAFVAVAPGAAHGSAKRWPAESFGALCRQLARALGQPCVLVGSARERALGAAVRRHAGRGDLVDLTGRTDLASLIGVLARARLMIGNDSGAAHVAASLGRPAIALFGSTSTRHSGPVGPRTRILSRSLPCSPCFERDCPLGHLDCLRGLAPETVVQAAGDVLRGVPA
jgi:heptosyltransferase-2